MISREPIEQGWHGDARLIVENHRFTMLVGDVGTGKTTFGVAMARRLTGRPPLVLPGTPETDLSHVFGHHVLAGEETRFCDGPLPLAAKTGSVLLVEEMALIPLETRAAFLALRGQDRFYNPLSGEVIPIPPAFRLIATSNSESLSCRRASAVAMARALYDDFLIIEVPPLGRAEVARRLRHHHPNASAALIERVVSLWEEYAGIGENAPAPDSPGSLGYRCCDHLLKLLEAGMGEEPAVRIALVNKYFFDPDLHATARLKNDLG